MTHVDRIHRADVVARPEIVRGRIHRQPIEGHELGPGRLRTAGAAKPPVWRKARPGSPHFWIPPVQRKTLTREDDEDRFAAPTLIKKVHRPARSSANRSSKLADRATS